MRYLLIKNNIVENIIESPDPLTGYTDYDIVESIDSSENVGDTVYVQKKYILTPEQQDIVVRSIIGDPNAIDQLKKMADEIKNLY